MQLCRCKAYEAANTPCDEYPLKSIQVICRHTNLQIEIMVTPHTSWRSVPATIKLAGILFLVEQEYSNLARLVTAWKDKHYE
jgi:hypothetical protein